MNRLSLSELSAIVSLTVLVGTFVVTLSRTVWLCAQVKTKMDELEKEFRSHTESTTLHRNPDSEARWTRLEETLKELTSTVNDIRANLPR